MWGWTLFALIYFDASSFIEATLIFPAIGDVLPCNDLPENCANMYYSIQKTDQSSLDSLNIQATSAANDAESLLTSVQTVASQAMTLADTIDPDNSRTNGGQIRVLPTGRSLVGLTPFMGTLSASIVAEAGKRYSDISSRMSQLTNSLAQVSAILQASQGAVNSQITTTSNRIQNAITSTSAQITDYVEQADGKMTSSAQQFGASIGNAPIATNSTLMAALNQEQNDFNNGMTALGSLTNQANQIPNTLQTYIQGALQRLQQFESDQQSAANAQVGTRSSQFAAQVSAATTGLTNQINGILSTNPRDSFYNTSLNGYIARHQQALYSQISAENATQQAKLSGMMNSLTSMSGSISGSFQAILTAVNLMLAQANNTDLEFLSAAQKALDDANSTLQTAQSSFQSFTTDMNTLWNTTGSILSGQTTAISAALLDKISNITQDAGAEVANLNSLMLTASSGALASDTVRQAVIGSTRQQIYSALGSNAAALNASFATINDFLNRSSTEIKFISDIVNVISGNRTQQLNETASAGLRGVYRQIEIVGDTTRNITDTLVANIKGDIAADVVSAQVALGGSKSALSLSANQTGDLIRAMNAANAAAFANFTAQVSAAKSLIEGTANTTAKLNSIASGIAGQGSAKQQAELVFLNQLIANATANMTGIVSGQAQAATGMQNTIQTALADLNANQTALLHNLANSLNNASTSYGSYMANISAVVNSIAAGVATNNSLAQQTLTDLESDLSAARTGVDNAYRSAVTQVQSTTASLVTAVESNATLIGSTAQKEVQNSLDSSIANVTSIVNGMVSGLTKNMTRVQGAVSLLSGRVADLQSKPQEMLDNALALANKYNMQLSDLKSNIVKVTADNDAKSDAFMTQLNATFGANGVQGMLDQLRSKIVDTKSEVNATLSSTLDTITDMVSSADAAMTVSARDYNAQIQAHRDQFQQDIDADTNSTVTNMGSSFAKFLDRLSDMKFRLDSTVNASGGIDGRIGSLSAQIADLQSQMSDPALTNRLSKDIADFGTNFTDTMQTFLNESGAALVQAESGVEQQQQGTANTALDGAQLLAEATTTLAQKVNATVDQILRASSLSQRATNQTTSALTSVALGANRTVTLTAAQIARIVAQFQQDSAATQQTLQAQLNASGAAQASVQDALIVWETLKATAENLTRDELDNLSGQRAQLLNFTDSSIAAAQADAAADLDAIASNLTQIQQSVNATHNSNRGVLDALIDQLASIAQNASEEQNEYRTEVSNLRGYVAQVTQQLASRFQSISQLGTPFRTALETAAANDISGIVRQV